MTSPKRGECILWDGEVIGKYGVVSKQENHVRRRTRAHRLAYERAKGPIPPGLQLDHLCRNTLCVNPDHLEPVSNRVNVLRGIGPSAQNARKATCRNGHAFDGVRATTGERFCYTCVNSQPARVRRRGSAEFIPRGPRQ